MSFSYYIIIEKHIGMRTPFLCLVYLSIFAEIYYLQSMSESVLEGKVTMVDEVLCPLCSHIVNSNFTGGVNTKLWHCNNCELIFKDPSERPSYDNEEQRYREHNNNDQNKGYVDFLKQAVNPALSFLAPEMTGLDFGCGPNPVLSTIVKQSGYDCLNYDPFFFPDLPDERMDFIFATESFEHFFYPCREIKMITALLHPSGILTVMTHRWKELDNIASWWYVRDKTHVSFYHRKTFDYICSKYGYNILYDDGEKVLVMEKVVVTGV